MTDTPPQSLVEEVQARHAAEQAERNADLPLEAERVLADLAALRAATDELLATFDGSERAEAARGVYIDGNGNIATRYGRLRAL